MLGIILHGLNELGKFNENLYYKFNQLTAFEKTISSCLQAEFAQKVIVAIPSSQRKKVQGGGIFNPLIKGDMSFLGRKALFHYYNDEKGNLYGLYSAALSYNLDHVLIINANSILLPSWLINNFILNYMEFTSHNEYFVNIRNNDFYNSSFKMELLPFWILAKEYLYSDNINSLTIDKPTLYFDNTSELNNLPDPKIDLSLNSLDHIEQLESIFSIMEQGADLGSLLEELNEQISIKV